MCKILSSLSSCRRLACTNAAVERFYAERTFQLSLIKREERIKVKCAGVSLLNAPQKDEIEKSESEKDDDNVADTDKEEFVKLEMYKSLSTPYLCAKRK